MMKHYPISLLVAIGLPLLFAQCNSTTQQKASQDSTAIAPPPPINTADTNLVAVLQMDRVVRLSDSLYMVFKVYNPTSDTLRFTQYHTPFEGFINNFLTITDDTGQEVPYRGAMAKRVMPPPADTYCEVAPATSDSIRFSIKKGYAITKPGRYTIQYNAGHVSGIANGKPITVQVVE